MNFKTYTEAGDTRRDFLKKLIGGAAATATGNLGKVVNSASKIAPTVLGINLDKLADVIFELMYSEEVDKYGDLQHEIMASTHQDIIDRGIATFEQLEDLLDNNESYKDIFYNSVEQQVAAGIRLICRNIAAGDLNYFNVNHFLRHELSKRPILPNTVYKFIKNGVPIDVNICQQMVSSISGENIMDTLESIQPTDMTVIYDSPVLQQLEAKCYQQTSDYIKSTNNKKAEQATNNVSIKLHRVKAQKVYNTLNQLI